MWRGKGEEVAESSKGGDMASIEIWPRVGWRQPTRSMRVEAREVTSFSLIFFKASS